MPAEELSRLIDRELGHKVRLARSFHGASACSVVDRAASCCRAVQAHGFSPEPVRSAHSAETAVPPGQVAPSKHVVSV